MRLRWPLSQVSGPARTSSPARPGREVDPVPDPRRIIREAWGDTDLEELLPDKDALSVATGGAAAGAAAKGARAGKKSSKDKGPKRAPFDDEAT